MPSLSSRYRRRARPVLEMVAWLSLLVTVAVGGSTLGHGALAPPPLGDPGAWSGWAAGRTPLEASFTVLGLVVMVLAWYLLAATVLVMAASLRGPGRLASVAGVLTSPQLRRVVHAALGVGLMGTSVAGPAAGARLPSSARMWPLPTVELVVAGAAGDTRMTGDEDVPVMRLLPDRSPDGVPSTTTPQRAAVEPAISVPQMGASEREVRPGDHLWSLAVQVLDDAGAATDDRQVATYWRQLIEANRDRLADPANPDLIFPGQVLAVPTPPAPAAPEPIPAAPSPGPGR